MQISSPQTSSHKKIETFYVKKRGLFRKAEQFTKHCNTDVFIVVHNKDSDKLFSYSNSDQFDIQAVTDLILRDV